jgi:Heterokaryon incompatibility protein (HET)
MSPALSTLRKSPSGESESEPCEMNRQQDDGCLAHKTHAYAVACQLDEISIHKMVLRLASEVVMPRKEFGATTICYLGAQALPRLKIDYIWIDSLCIIQDSEVD